MLKLVAETLLMQFASQIVQVHFYLSIVVVHLDFQLLENDLLQFLLKVLLILIVLLPCHELTFLLLDLRLTHLRAVHADELQLALPGLDKRLIAGLLLCRPFLKSEQRHHFLHLYYNMIKITPGCARPVSL